MPWWVRWRGTESRRLSEVSQPTRPWPAYQSDVWPGVRRCDDGAAERILFAGLVGSGKSTLAREVAQRLDLPLTVLDDLYYGPGLSIRDDFVNMIDAVTGGIRWVIDSQGAPLSSPAPAIHRELMWDRADTVMWLDYPKRIVLARGFKRHLLWVVTRERLWHGYVEPFRDWFDAGHPLRRAWSGTGCAGYS